jgi:hypothetical protein
VSAAPPDVLTLLQGHLSGGTLTLDTTLFPEMTAALAVFGVTQLSVADVPGLDQPSPGDVTFDGSAAVLGVPATAKKLHGTVTTVGSAITVTLTLTPASAGRILPGVVPGLPDSFKPVESGPGAPSGPSVNTLQPSIAYDGHAQGHDGVRARGRRARHHGRARRRRNAPARLRPIAAGARPRARRTHGDAAIWAPERHRRGGAPPHRRGARRRARPADARGRRGVPAARRHARGDRRAAERRAVADGHVPARRHHPGDRGERVRAPRRARLERPQRARGNSRPRAIRRSGGSRSRSACPRTSRSWTGSCCTRSRSAGRW